jgi:quinol monooxygenase YgiN
MNITLCVTVRARCHAYSFRLGLCLARLDGACASDRGCLLLRVYHQGLDPMTWLVEGLWRSAESREAFLNSEALHQVLAEAISEDLIASLRFTTLPLQRIARS